MRVRTYQLLRDKIEEGVRSGLVKADKHEQLSLGDDAMGPLEDAAVDTIMNYVMSSICEYFDWDDEAT